MVGKCTPEELDELVDTATRSVEEKGKIHECYYKLLDKIEGASEVSETRQNITDALGKLIYSENGKYCKMSLQVFQELYKKLSWYGPKCVKLFIKGKNAIALQLDGFDFSDLDIGIYINPDMSKENFDKIYSEVNVVCGQVIAKHKQNLDRTFFRTREGVPGLFDNDLKIEFEEKHIEAFKFVDVTSCFVSSDIRNFASASSIMLTDSVEYKDRVVRIELPHFKNAERIPLDRTPIFCSVNDTICKVFDDGRKCNINLYRIKLGAIVESESSGDSDDCTEDEDTPSIVASKTSADFVDITIPKQDDSELLDFAKNFGFERNSPLTSFVLWNGWKVTCSSIVECVRDLEKGVSLFDCPQSKKDKKVLLIKQIKEMCNVDHA